MTQILVNEAQDITEGKKGNLQVHHILVMIVCILLKKSLTSTREVKVIDQGAVIVILSPGRGIREIFLEVQVRIQ